MAARPIHRDDARRFVWGVVVIIVLTIVGTLGVIVQTGRPLPGRSYTYVKAAFYGVGVLEKGKDVKQDGITIGTVSDVTHRDGEALVTLRLDGERAVYSDATAAMGNGSALGKQFISFDPGTPAAGDLGDREISAERTKSATQIEDIFAALDPKTRTALRSTLSELAEGMAGHGQDLNDLLAASPTLLADLEKVAEAASSNRAEVPKLIDNADRLVGRFDGREREIEALMDNADTTLAAVDVDHGRPLEQTIEGLPATLTSARQALDSLDKPLGDAHVAVGNLRTGGNALGRSTPDLRAFLRDSRGPLGRVPGVADTATPAVQDLTGTLRDARPLLPRVDGAVRSLDQLLYAFVPYAGDAGRFFSQDALLSGTLGDKDHHYFAAALTAVGLATVAGAPDPLYRNEPYPCPGTAWNHATVTDCSGGVR